MDNILNLVSTNSLVEDSVQLVTEADELKADCLFKAEDLFKKIQILRLISILKLIGESEALNEVLTAEEDAFKAEEKQLLHGNYAKLASYFLSTTKTANYEDINSNSSSTSKKTGFFQKIADFLANKRRA